MRADLSHRNTTEERTERANFVITGEAEQTDESSYTAQATGELVTKIPLTLNIPGVTDWARCEMPLEVSPKPAVLEQRGMEQTWLVVLTNTMRALGFTGARRSRRKRSGGAGDLPGH